LLKKFLSGLVLEKFIYFLCKTPFWAGFEKFGLFKKRQKNSNFYFRPFGHKQT